MNPRVNESISLDFFYDLLRIRMVEETIAKKYFEQKMRCPVHFSIGQEAIAVGVCKALKTKDNLLSTHRSHAHYLAKGGSLKKMLAEIYGKKDGCSMGRGGSMHLVDLDVNFIGSTPIVGGIIPIATGLSFASLLKNEDRITVVFFGDGSTEEGVWAECLNFASLKNLPIIFVCENNFFSVYSPLNVRQSEFRDRIAIARAHGLYAEKGDGNNVEEVYQLTKRSYQNILQGKGPCFLEFDTYRFLEHCGPNNDNDLGYRKLEEVLTWKENCPLKRYEKKLREENILNNEALADMKIKITAEIEEAFCFAESSLFPEFNIENEGIYAKKQIS